eukprot:3902208-Rhodomonas_salina.2
MPARTADSPPLSCDLQPTHLPKKPPDTQRRPAAAVGAMANWRRGDPACSSLHVPAAVSNTCRSARATQTAEHLPRPAKIYTLPATPAIPNSERGAGMVPDCATTLIHESEAISYICRSVRHTVVPLQTLAPPKTHRFPPDSTIFAAARLAAADRGANWLQLAVLIVYM